MVDFGFDSFADLFFFLHTMKDCLLEQNFVLPSILRSLLNHGGTGINLKKKIQEVRTSYWEDLIDGWMDFFLNLLGLLGHLSRMLLGVMLPQRIIRLEIFHAEDAGREHKRGAWINERVGR